MIGHIFLPGVNFDSLQLLPEYADWLSLWLSEVEHDIENGDIASSVCLQGVISEIILYGSPQTDWLGVMDTYLRDTYGKPIAYSEKYGLRLYKFTHWLQSEVHAIHARWWISQVCTSPFTKDNVQYGTLIEQLIQPNGLIYNPDISKTHMKTRMRSEYLMSLAMGLEILDAFDLIKDREELFESILSSVHLTQYLSAEYFRLYSLETLKSIELAPTNLPAVLEACEAGKGYCDFAVKDKVDDYMGTAKRTARDLAVHSPLSSLHARHIASLAENDIRVTVVRRLTDFGRYLRLDPLNIPAFKIRDLDIPFGSDVTPLEVIAANAIIDLV
jgi:hypothetical protein